MTDTQNANQLFEHENGMTVDEAYQYVQKWKFEGKKEEAIRGCKEILKFFPDHEGAQTILNQLGGLDARIEQASSKIIDKVGDKLHEMTHREPTNSSENITSAPVEHQEDEENVPVSFASPTQEEEDLHVAEQKLTTNDERNWAAVSYLWIFVLIPLLLKKYNNSLYVKFHLRQGLMMFLIFFFFEWLILNILSLFLPDGVVYIAKSLVFVMFGVLAFMAWQGKWFRIPVIYNFSKKIPL